MDGGALLGLLVSLISMAVLYLFQRTPDAGDWLIWIWPSSLELMALEYQQAPLWVVLTFSIAIGFNMILYAGIAWCGAFIYAQTFGSVTQ